MQELRSNHPLIIKIAVAVLVLIALWGGYSLWKSTTFYITSTDPSVDKVSTISPYLQITFSQPLSAGSVRVSSSSAFIGTPRISNKTLTIPFNALLSAGKTYSVTLINISSSKGKTITNRVFSFTPTYIPSSQLSASQQQALLKHESHTGPVFTGIEGLGSYGLDADEITNLEQVFMTFKPTLKQVVIDQNSINIGAYNANTPNPRAPIVFNVSIDGKKYQASVLGSDSDSSVTLTLRDPQSGAQLFSGNSTTSSPDS